MQFYILELRRKFEDVKELINRSLTAVLLVIMRVLKRHCSKALLSHHFAIISCFVVIAISVFVRSQRDIGYDSAFYLDFYINAGREIFGNGLSLIIFLSSIPHVLSKILTISPIISLEIYVNILGIISLYFSSKILRRSGVVSDLILFNLIIVSYAIGFFLRVFTLSLNEFGTSSTYFLIIAFPYISYQFLDQSQRKNFDKRISDVLAILLICLKPYYAILAIVFELKRGRFVAAIFYLFLLFLMAADPVISKEKIYLLSIIFRQDLFPFLTVVILNYSLIQKSQPLKIFALATAAIAMLIIAEMMMGDDQRIIFYVPFLSFLMVLVLEIIRQGYLNWKRDGVILFFMAVVLQFSHDVFIDLIFNLSSFWWIFAVILALSWKRQLFPNDLSYSNRAERFLLQRDIISNILLIVALFITVYCAMNNSPFGELFISITVFLLLVKSNQNLHEKLTGFKEFSRLSSCIILIIMSYLISLHRVAIFVDHEHISPNYVNDSMIDIIQTKLAKGDQFLIISDIISDSYPLMNYVGGHRGISSFKASLSIVTEQLKQQNNKIIFVGANRQDGLNACFVGVIENYMKNPEFRKYFLENYVFLNRMTATQMVRQKVKFEREFENEKVDFRALENIEMIDRDIEVYIRREG